MKLVKESLITESNYPAFTGNVEGTLVIRHNVERSLAKDFARYLNGNKQRIKEAGGVNDRDPKIREFAEQMNLTPRELSFIVSDEFEEVFYDDIDESVKLTKRINENKDLQRIKDIKNKARNWDEEYKLASTQAKRIQDPEKAFRRWENALYVGGEKWIVTQIFFRRALQLKHPEALQIQEEKMRKYS